MIAVYAVVAAALVYIARDRINPDAIAYIQNARHYAAGRLDLAVNGWFGPLISWLLVPAVWIGGEPAVWFRVYNAVFGVILAAGSVRLTRRVLSGGASEAGGSGAMLPAPERWGRLVFVAALLLSLGVVGNELTPDLLLAAAMAWYFCAAHSLLFSGGPRRAFAVGVLGGLCYLIKGYALIFVAAHLTMTLFFRCATSSRPPLQRGSREAPCPSPHPAVAAKRQPRDEGRKLEPAAVTPAEAGACYTAQTESARGSAPGCWRAWAAALAGAVLAAAPWIAVLSAQTGRLTISTITQASDALRPNPPPAPLPIHLLQETTPGRITNWENPAEIPLPWGRWETQGEWDRFGRILETAGLNAKEAEWAILRLDLAGLLFFGWWVGLAACFFRDQRASGSSAVRLWLCLTACLYTAGLLSLWVVPRFFWVLWAPLLAVFASALTVLECGGNAAAFSDRGAGSKAAASPPHSKRSLPPMSTSSFWRAVPRRRLAQVLAAALILSIAGELGRYVFLDDSGPLRKGREATRLRLLARECNLAGPVITNKAGWWSEDNWYRGLFATYWAAGPRGDKAQFLGEFDGWSDYGPGNTEPAPAWVLFYSEPEPGRHFPGERPTIRPAPARFTVLLFDARIIADDLSYEFRSCLAARTVMQETPPRVDVLQFDFGRLPPAPSDASP